MLDMRSILRCTPARNVRPNQRRPRSRPRDPLTQAAAEWLESKHDWTHWATLTFDEDLKDAAARRALKSWMRSIARIVGDRHVPVVHGLEHTAKGRPHFHALIALPPHQDDPGMLALGLSPDPVPDYAQALGRLWLRADHRAGRMHKIEPYRRQGGAAEYLVKDGDWQPDTACPRLHACRRDQGCIEAATMWGNE